MSVCWGPEGSGSVSDARVAVMRYVVKGAYSPASGLG